MVLLSSMKLGKPVRGHDELRTKLLRTDFRKEKFACVFCSLVLKERGRISRRDFPTLRPPSESAKYGNSIVAGGVKGNEEGRWLLVPGTPDMGTRGAHIGKEDELFSSRRIYEVKYHKNRTMTNES